MDLQLLDELLEEELLGPHFADSLVDFRQAKLEQVLRDVHRGKMHEWANAAGRVGEELDEFEDVRHYLDNHVLHLLGKILPLKVLVKNLRVNYNVVDEAQLDD